MSMRLNACKTCRAHMNNLAATDPDTPLGQAASGEVIKTYEEVVMTAALDDLLRDNTSRLLRGGRETKNMDEDIEVPTL